MQMILFKMNQQFYLISAAAVEEVIDTMEITKVPLAPAWIEGLINLRGTVMTVVSLAELLNIEAPQTSRNILIMKQEDDKKGLLIDEVVEVVNVETTDIQLSDKQQTPYYTGIVMFDDKVANVIDVSRMIFAQ